MENKKTITALLIYTLGIGCVNAYETPTHETISKTVFKKSVLSKSDGILVDLGLKIPADIYDDSADYFFDYYLPKRYERNIIGHIRFGSS